MLLIEVEGLGFRNFHYDFQGLVRYFACLSCSSSKISCWCEVRSGICKLDGFKQLENGIVPDRGQRRSQSSNCYCARGHWSKIGDQNIPE